MKAPRTAHMLAFAVVALFVVSALSVVGTAAAPSVLTHNSSSSTSGAASTPATPSAASSANVNAHNVASEMASSALAATKAAGISTHYVFPPRPSATAAEVAQSKAHGYVTPLYTGVPAPMGLGYFGTSAASNGSVTPTILNTTSVQAYVDTTGAGIVANDLFQSSPDSYGIQLNAVTTNVTLFGHGGYSFWTQNVVEFYPDSGFLVFVTNVWNFSGGALSANVFYNPGPGVQVGTEYYYAEAAVAGISYPFNLTLTMSSAIADNRNAVYFSDYLTGPSIPAGLDTFLSNWDYVIFNSLAPNATGPVAVSNYEANGYAYNPIGLTDDFELIFGGPGGGSQATLSSADATLGLATWDGSAYVSVPSAVSYGGETGETVAGANIAWSNAPGNGPTGMSTYGTMTTGPSILEGLWNATGAAGSYPVTITGAPTNAFNLVTPLGGNPNFQIDEPSVAPGVFGTTLYLMPGNYSIKTELSGYSPVTNTIDVTGPVSVPAAIASNPSAGIYTPLWAFSNSQLAAISSGGSGTVASPYLLLNAGTPALGTEFGLYNDFTFPVFPGVFLMGTTASVEIANEPSLTVATNAFAFPGQYLPATNSPQFWFWNVSNVAIVNTTFSGGWFGANAFYPISFDTFNVIFYASTNNLVYKDTFATPGQGLLLFAGSSAFGPSTGGGGNNTVWGSTFYQTVVTGCPSLVCETLFPYSYGLGLQAAEGNDTFVNNAFANPTTAWQVTANMYTGYPQFYVNTWNVTPGHILAPLANFPNLAFSGGNILGGLKQGGNYWWDYGYLPFNPFNGAVNPIGVLPYDENATTFLVNYGPSYYSSSYIFPGGDSAPLSPIVYAVTFSEFGLPSGAPWGVVTSAPTSVLFPHDLAVLEGGSMVGGPSVTLYLPNGTYGLTSLYAGEVIHTPTSFTVSGAPAKVTVSFYTSASYGYLKFRESGLPIGTLWTVSVEVAPSVLDNQSSTTNTIVFLLPRGIYTFAVPNTANGYEPKLLSGTVHLGAVTTVAVKFFPYVFNVVFVESGLGAGKSWSVQLTGMISGHTKLFVGHSKTSTIQFTVPNGTYSFTVKPIPAYKITPGTGTLTVNGSEVIQNVTFSTATFAVTFTESGLPSGTNWSVTIGATTYYSTTTTIVINLPDGTYHYTLSTTLAGYTGTGSPRSVHVHGAPVAVSVTFHSKPVFRD